MEEGAVSRGAVSRLGFEDVKGPGVAGPMGHHVTRGLGQSEKVQGCAAVLGREAGLAMSQIK